jgi:hypothetical protein
MKADYEKLTTVVKASGMTPQYTWIIPSLRAKRSNPLRHSGATPSIEPGISRFPDAQLRIGGNDGVGGWIASLRSQ